MKKIAIVILLAVCAACILTAQKKAAPEFYTDGNGTITGWKYLDAQQGQMIAGEFIIPAAILDVEMVAREFIIPAVIDGKPVTAVGDSAFDAGVWSEDFYWGVITSVTIPKSVTHIGKYAFWEQFNLASLTIPDSVTYIGEGAFYECGLTSVTINNAYIGDYAFSWCDLTDVTIGKGVEFIGANAFAGNPLERVTIKTNNVVFVLEEKSDNNRYTYPTYWEDEEDYYAWKSFPKAYFAGGAGTYVYQNGSWRKQ